MPLSGPPRRHQQPQFSNRHLEGVELHKALYCGLQFGPRYGTFIRTNKRKPELKAAYQSVLNNGFQTGFALHGPLKGAGPWSESKAAVNAFGNAKSPRIQRPEGMHNGKDSKD
jgi:hypothetical protein